jgi:hypothetical protein
MCAQAAMAAEGIELEKRYQHDTVADALSLRLGSRVALHTGRRGDATELWMCLDHNLTAFDCPGNVVDEGHKSKWVNFPFASAQATLGGPQSRAHKRR